MLVGNGNVQRMEYHVSNSSFDSIFVDGTVEVHLTQGNKQLIEIESDENLHHTSAIQISVDQNCLTVKDHNCQYTKMIAYIQFPESSELKSLNLNGAGSVQTTNELHSSTNTFTLTVNGTRKADLKLNLKNDLHLKMNGTTQLILSGAVKKLANIKQSGTTEFFGKECKMNQVTAALQGASTAYITAQDEINVNVQGVSSVFYRGPLKEKIIGAITCQVQQF